MKKKDKKKEKKNEWKANTEKYYRQYKTYNPQYKNFTVVAQAPEINFSSHNSKKIERQYKTMREKKTRKTCTVAAQAAENRVRLGVG